MCNGNGENCKTYKDINTEDGDGKLYYMFVVFFARSRWFIDISFEIFRRRPNIVVVERGCHPGLAVFWAKPGQQHSDFFFTHPISQLSFFLLLFLK